MSNLGQFRTFLQNELGLDCPADGTGTENTVADAAINKAVERVLIDTHCYVKLTNFSAFDGASLDYTLDSTILEIVELFSSASDPDTPLERLSVQDLLYRRRTTSPSGSPTYEYALAGANLLMFYPAPGVSDVLSIYHVPVPTALSLSSHDPSSTTYGGIPTTLHEAIEFYAASRAGSYDDDQTSAQGQRYRDWYKEEITRHKLAIRKKGGARNARAVVNDKRVRQRRYARNDVY